MKYFVCIKESYYNRCTKELFYQRLMQKRVGKGKYILHKKNMPKLDKFSLLLNSSNNMFNGYVIEFADKMAFSKFKLSYKSLLNPSLERPSERISSCKSFCVDDDYDSKIDIMVEKYQILENRKHNLSNILYGLNSIITIVKSLKHSSETSLNENVSISEKYDIDLDFDKDIIKKLINVSSDIENILKENNVNFTHKTTTYYGEVSNVELLYEYQKQINDIKEEAKTLFFNIVDLEIPDQK